MGHYITKLLSSFSQMKAKILMLGLDNAGKTTVLFRMKLNEQVQTLPTIGFNVEQVNYKGLKFTIWDIGGQTKLRGMWHHYYQYTDAVIYVLDTSDIDRFELAKEALDMAIQSDQMKDVPVLVLANKVDQAQVKMVEVVEKLGLHKEKRRQWHVQPTCALNGEGIVEGFQWLKNAIKRRK